jgi:hypothetical protein
MESMRQMIGAVYLAVTAAGGEKALRSANRVLTLALEAGAVSDPYARSALRTLVNSAEELPPRTARKSRT